MIGSKHKIQLWRMEYVPEYTITFTIEEVASIVDGTDFYDLGQAVYNKLINPDFDTVEEEE